MSDYQVTTATVSSLRGQLTLPMFQRGKVWKYKQKVELIKSLHRGYPFGSLLTYQNSSSEKETLLDGQQRWLTILEYKNDNVKFWKNLNNQDYELGFSTINSWIISEDKIKYEDYDSVLSGKENLANWADDALQKYDFNGKTARDLRDKIDEYKEKISEYLKVDDIQIPVIRYTGERKNTARVFENLNKSGTQLTKFEIFAASFSDIKITLENTDLQEEILSIVKQYYIKKREGIKDFLSLDDFSEEDFTSHRKVNLYQLGFAIGEFTKRKLPALVNDKVKTKNEVGFGILAISTDVDPKNLKDLANQQSYLSKNLEQILVKIKTISKNLSEIFHNMIHQNIDGIPYQRGLNTTYKTLSYFAALWTTVGDAEKKILQNIPSYYIFDSLSKSWGNAGDSRLFDYYPSQNVRSYEKDMNDKDSKARFLAQFNQWIEENKRSNKNFNSEVKALTTIHANTSYLSAIITMGEPYQLEHIYPKARVGAKDEKNKVLLGNLDNCMYLPKSVNRNKQTKTLYDLDNFDRFKQLIKDSSYPSDKDFKLAFESLEKGDTEIINKLILKRAKVVAEQIVNKVCTQF